MPDNTTSLEVFVAPLTPRAILPRKGHATDAGLDLAIPEEQTILASRQGIVDLEIAVEIPTGWYGQIFGRSSVFRRGLYIHPGVIDAGYRGTIQLLVENRSPCTQYLHRGDRLAQLLLLPVPLVTIQPVSPEALSQTTRGAGGLGSTGR